MMALELGERGLLTLRWDPVWDDLRSDDLFKELVRQTRSLRLPPTLPGRGGRGGRGGGGNGG